MTAKKHQVHNLIILDESGSMQSIKPSIINGFNELVQSVKGIGLKTAQRVIIELKDKVLKVYDIDEAAYISNNTNKDEALSALEVLGFNKKMAEKVMDKLVKESPEASVEALIKLALKNL